MTALTAEALAELERLEANKYRGLIGDLSMWEFRALDAFPALLAAAKEAASLREKLEAMKQQAQCHAMEARTANATIAEIYQVVTGATGEPGNWHGAQPVRDAFGKLREKLAEAERERDALAKWLQGGAYRSVWVAALRPDLGDTGGNFAARADDADVPETLGRDAVGGETLFGAINAALALTPSAAEKGE